MKSEYERFISKVKVMDNDNCWEWVGSTYRGGYGHFRRFINNKWTMGKAHRFSYEYYNKTNIEEMKGLIVCHKCDNPCCVNPNHLFLGTTQDNVNDKINKYGNSFGRNKNHNWLNIEIADKIRKTYKDNPNLSYKELSLIYNTSIPQICRIILNKIWKRKVGT